MKLASPNISPNKALIGILILCLSMLPLLGLHIHLPASHMGTDTHFHQAETHGFHLHTTQHENVFVDGEHSNDSQSVKLVIDTRLLKIVKIFAIVVLFITLLSAFITCRTITLFNYDTPVLNPFEYFRALLRGPPAI